MARHIALGCLAAACLLGLRVAFITAGPGAPAGGEAPLSEGASIRGAARPSAATEDPPSFMASASKVLAGVVLGLALLGATAGPARADIEDVAVPLDGKGKTVTLTKEGLIRGKRLFNVACATCHVGGGTRINQNVGLAKEELAGALPPRDNVNAIIDFINAPMTYDGLYDISETHPSIRSADLFRKMRSMKQQDLYDISAYILYETEVIPEKWGGGKQYY